MLKVKCLILIFISIILLVACSTSKETKSTYGYFKVLPSALPYVREETSKPIVEFPLAAPLGEGCDSLTAISRDTFFKTFEDAFNWIETYYIEIPDTSSLIIGAVVGMETLLDAQHITYSKASSQINKFKDKEEALATFKQIASDYAGLSQMQYGALLDSAIKGMTNTLNHNAEYKNADEYKEMAVKFNSNPVSVGIDIEKKSDVMVNISPLTNTPAYNAGIRPGDIVIKIDGIPTKTLSGEEIDSRLRGAVGTSVAITVIRGGWSEPKDFILFRNIIETKSVEYRIVESKLGYIKINRFHEETEKQLINALNNLQSNKITSLIIDLRYNPGGNVKSVIDAAALFSPTSKKILFSVTDRMDKNRPYYAEESLPPFNGTIVVIVNAWTGGTAEMLAQGLRDWKRAIIVGERTRGLYIIKTFIPLKNCARLILPTGEFFSPDGNNFRNGVVPDIDLRTQEQTDVPFEFAQSLLNKINGPISYESLKEMAESSLGKVIQ